MENINDFSRIEDNETARLAQMSPEECEEYEKWLDIFMGEVVRDVGM